MKSYYQQDSFQLTSDKITEEHHPVFGDMTIFHGVVIASEIVQPYEDGKAWKPRDELEKYAPYVDGRWVIAGAHPEQGIISDTGQVAGRTVNPHYVKDLKDPSTKRPCRAGVRADVQIFNNKVTPSLLEDMKTGKKQDVSIGFFFSKDEQKGVVDDGPFKGLEYDYVQRNMFHDHLAAGIDNGRCPMPYCGLGADEVKQELTGDPFAGFSSFGDCVSKIMAKNPEMSEESARKICGKLKSEKEDNKTEDEALKQRARAVLHALMDELEEVQGMKDAKIDEISWEERIPWKEEPYTTAFDHLDEETRLMLTEKGLCPHCPEKDEESEEECEEGYEKNEEGECVKMEETDVKEKNPGFVVGGAEHECPEGMEWNAEKKTCVEVKKLAKKDALDPREVIRRFEAVSQR